MTFLYASSSNYKPAKLRVPDYYWKAFLKVKWENGKVTSASSIAFWFEHRNYPKENNEKFDQNDPEHGKPPFFCSVNTVEDLIGFDLFTNLPDDLEETVEAIADWEAFMAFR